MAKKSIQTSAIGLFMIVIMLPLLQQHWGLVFIPPLQENRHLKAMPTNYVGLLQPGMSFSKEFEEYFNDNYGFRDLLIRSKNQADFTVFRKSEKVFIGRDGYLFYKSVVDEDEVQIEKMTAAEWETMCERILRLHKTLADKGITLVMVPCPMKNSIYPEMAPADAPRRPNPTNFQRYRAFLKSHPEIMTIDPTPLLMKLKTSMQVFCRTDFHWTDGAAAYVAKELVNQIGNSCGRNGLWSGPIQTVIKETAAGGESRSLALLWESSEMLPFASVPQLDKERGEYAKESNAYEWTYTSNITDKSRLLPDTVMFGDSFSDAWVRAGFTGHFSRVQRFYNWDFEKNYKNIPDGTRYVIFQHCETVKMLNHTPFWPQELRGQ